MEREPSPQDSIDLEEVLGEGQRGQDHQVLGPLVGPEGDEERSGQGHRPPYRARVIGPRIGPCRWREQTRREGPPTTESP